MKKALVVLAVILVVIAAVIIICEKDNNMIVLEMSEEAKQHEEEVVSKDPAKEEFNEDNFFFTMATTLGRGEQVLPKCEVNNTVGKETFMGCNVYTLTHEGYDTIVYYIHGGAWSFEIAEEHVTFCDELATRLNAKVYMPLYPLAPQATSEETYKMIEGLYKEIVKEGKDVYVMGDSAGGNIALGLMYTIKEEGLTKPAKMVLMAPCSDMTFTNKDIEELNKIDPELEVFGCKGCAVIWAGTKNIETPKYSAVKADVTGYPDTMIIQGTNDILYSDNVILYHNMRAAGVNAVFVEGRGLWHVFGVSPIPEREEVLNLITAFCEK